MAGWTPQASHAAYLAASPAKADELAFYAPLNRPWLVMLAEGWRLAGDLGHHSRHAVLLIREVRP
jgi:hypothetical protein